MTSSTDIVFLYPAIDLEAYFFMRIQRCLTIFNVLNGDSGTWWYFKGPWIDIVSLNISIELIYMLLSLETSILTVIVVFLFITFVIVISCIIIIVVFLFWSTRVTGIETRLTNIEHHVGLHPSQPDAQQQPQPQQPHYQPHTY
ncbi:hypothetical protein BDC45DRAFT_523667, partial [Circinella umbellata]